MRRGRVLATGVAVVVVAGGALLAPIAPATAGHRSVVLEPRDQDPCATVTVPAEMSWSVRRGPVVARWTDVALATTSIRIDVDPACAADERVSWVGADLRRADRPDDGTLVPPLGGVGWAEDAAQGDLRGEIGAPDLDLASGWTGADGEWCGDLTFVVEVTRTGADGITRTPRLEHPVRVCTG
ncbi:hypothetical protein [Cellulomonas sp. HD19AZ1]|uniref:hypothetical protein n=1 Tax=Cellulomonas sp. HD19AZ1 TaxID=2559593 RepID=UPI001070BEE0|nr:hypothetical protein [Cellulomonas sp. HD19AZ1]TFH74038.1 hypothetical protein E4A51_00795 [Cellulomonas sp. HD19AZ1]